MQKVLVFFPTYNEAGNVALLIQAIREQLPGAHILVVDDASPDGTGDILEQLAFELGDLKVVHRPGKLGLGSAHKLAMLYARDHGYDALITMDADFSHAPRYLPEFIEHLKEAEFVTGSRYTAGGKCDYGFGRTLISRTANLFAKSALGLKLLENTTLYRGFRASLLERMNIDAIQSEGYSFAVESVHQVAQLTDRMLEFPIHFEHRAAGASKISKAEIYKAILTIQRLGLRRLLPFGLRRSELPNRAREEPVRCVSCQSTYQIAVYPAKKQAKSRAQDISPYSCATHSSRTHGEILKCLNCGLIFMKPELTPAELVQEYASAEDPVYRDNIQARITTFRYNLAQVRRYFSPGARVLEIGSYCGAFLKVAREEGIDITGVEPSAWAASVSSSISDAPVIQGTTADVPEGLGKFDVAVAWDVLEHFADPVSELHRIHRLLADDGKLLFSTLMIDNWFPKLAGRHWPWFMDMHLFYFTEASIRNVLKQTGFEVIDARNYCHIVTLEYLLSKVGTLGAPGGQQLSEIVAQNALGKLEIPFRFGDIKLFVCRKAGDAVRSSARRARPSSKRNGSPPALADRVRRVS
jgi:glycosyltransferase involved in cell wall biosynthesis/2-polyprenyl-3-methyl-5-hydroxy-6-metoxy-1,4-benzoquinol methylase